MRAGVEKKKTPCRLRQQGVRLIERNESLRRVGYDDQYYYDRDYQDVFHGSFRGQ